MYEYAKNEKIKNYFLRKKMTLKMTQIYLVKLLFKIRRERNNLQKKINSEEIRNQMYEEIKDWFTQLKYNFFPFHSSDAPDKEFSELYWKYFNEEEIDFEELLAQEKYSEIKVQIRYLFSELTDFLSRIKENPEYPQESIQMYKYKDGCTFQEQLHF